MGAMLGALFLLQDRFDGVNYETVGGLKATSMMLGNTMVDTTSIKSGGWREILADCGNQTMQITASGIFKNSDAEARMIGYWNNRTLNFFRIYFPNGNNFYAAFQVNKLSYDGAFDGAVQYSVTLESSGEIAYTGPES